MNKKTNRQNKAESLAGAGLGVYHHVGAFEGVGKSQPLHQRHLGVGAPLQSWHIHTFIDIHVKTSLKYWIE